MYVFVVSIVIFQIISGILDTHKTYLTLHETHGDRVAPGPYPRDPALRRSKHLASPDPASCRFPRGAKRGAHRPSETWRRTCMRMCMSGVARAWLAEGWSDGKLGKNQGGGRFGHYAEPHAKKRTR